MMIKFNTVHFGVISFKIVLLNLFPLFIHSGSSLNILLPQFFYLLFGRNYFLPNFDIFVLLNNKFIFLFKITNLVLQNID